MSHVSISKDKMSTKRSSLFVPIQTFINRKLSSDNFEQLEESPPSSSPVRRMRTAPATYSDQKTVRLSPGLNTGHVSLNIPEKILLLCMTQNGRVKSSVSNLDLLLMWGYMCELALCGRIETFPIQDNSTSSLDSNNKKTRYGIRVNGTTPMFDDILGELLDKIMSNNCSREGLTIAEHVHLLDQENDETQSMVQRTVNRLCRKGLLIERKLLGSTTYPLASTWNKEQIRRDISGVLDSVDMEDSSCKSIQGMDAALYALIMLMYGFDNLLTTEVLKKIFGRKDKDIIPTMRLRAYFIIMQHRNWQEGLNSPLYESIYHIVSECWKR